MSVILFPKESYKLIDLCMEVHKELGMGFREAYIKMHSKLNWQRTIFTLPGKRDLKLSTKEIYFPIFILLILLFMIK